MNVHHFGAASRTGGIVALGICAICPTTFLSLTLWLCILLCYHHHKTLLLLLSSSPCLPLAASGWMAAFSLAAASLSCICFSMYCSISGHVSSVAFQRFKHRSVVAFPLFPFTTGPKYLLISSSMTSSEKVPPLSSAWCCSPRPAMHSLPRTCLWFPATIIK